MSASNGIKATTAHFSELIRVWCDSMGVLYVTDDGKLFWLFVSQLS